MREMFWSGNPGLDFIIYLNNAAVVWYSKRQGTVETSVFEAEFVAMKVGFEACRGLR
jgi:hypothetical protein